MRAVSATDRSRVIDLGQDLALGSGQGSDGGTDANFVDAAVGPLATGSGKVLFQLDLLGAGAPGPVGIDSQAPGDRDQPGPGWTVLHVKVVAVGPGPQHGFLDEVLGTAAITAGQRGGQS